MGIVFDGHSIIPQLLHDQAVAMAAEDAADQGLHQVGAGLVLGRHGQGSQTLQGKFHVITFGAEPQVDLPLQGAAGTVAPPDFFPVVLL